MRSQRENVGGLIKASKRKHTWTFKLAGKQHEILLFHSRLHGQVTVVLDGAVKVRAPVRRYEEYPLNIDGRVVYVYKSVVGNYDIRVGRFAFSKLVSERARLSKMASVDFEASNNETLGEIEALRFFPSSKGDRRRLVSFLPSCRI